MQCLAVDHRRSETFCIMKDAPTSPLHIGEISVFLTYRRMYFTVVHRRDISLPLIQMHLPRRCSTARYRSSLYTDTCTSPLPVFLIYRRMYLAVVHRRGGGSILDNLLNNTYYEVGEFCLVLYIETVT